jgi:hypothetical protein
MHIRPVHGAWLMYPKRAKERHTPRATRTRTNEPEPAVSHNTSPKITSTSPKIRISISICHLGLFFWQLAQHSFFNIIIFIFIFCVVVLSMFIEICPTV